MSTTTTITTSDELADVVTAAAEGSTTALVGAMLMEAVYELKSLERRMLLAARQIERDAANAVRYITDGDTMNSLGHFHHTPMSFDVKCAERNALVLSISQFVFAINKSDDAITVDREALFAELAAKAANADLANAARMLLYRRKKAAK